MKTINMNTNGLMAKLGLLAMLAGVMVMGGCASTRGYLSEIAQKAGNGDEIILVGQPSGLSNDTSKAICTEFPKDERCKNIGNYKGVSLWISETAVPFAPIKTVPVLVPKNVEFPRASLLKVRIKGDAPAYFEEIAAIGLDKPDCYRVGLYGRGSGGPGGVICPKYNYDYRNVLGIN